MSMRLAPGRVTLYPGEPTLFVVEPGGPVLPHLERRMVAPKAHARATVRRETGHLLSTIRTQPVFRATYVAVDLVAGGRGKANAYTMVEEAGSTAHWIKARKRKALRFQVGGSVVFRTKVWHPGTRGSRFLRSSLPLAARPV